MAAARRDLPPGGAVPKDYVFQEAGADTKQTEVKLSELFAPGKDTLGLYNFMFPVASGDDRPCPSCTQFLDSFDGAAEHLAQPINLAVVAKAPLRRYLPRNAGSVPWLRQVVGIVVDRGVIAVSAQLSRNHRGKRIARRICRLIQGADVADFTPGHTVFGRNDVVIRACPARTASA